MAVEIERKFLVNVDKLPKNLSTGAYIRQGYLSEFPYPTVRIRSYNSNFFLTIKGNNKGITRQEFEYSIPKGDALSMFALCPRLIEKTRVLLNDWEINFFHGRNEGLVVAKIELDSEDQEFDKPDWLGEEVSYDNKYFNNNCRKTSTSIWNNQRICSFYGYRKRCKLQRF